MEENNTQVMQMRRIYKHARHIIIWLGPLGATAAVGVDLLR